MNRNEHNRKQTIEDIRTAFIKLYEKSGINKLSIKEICEHAGISKPLFYRYFDDKYDVLESIERDLLSDIAEINKDLTNTSLFSYRKGQPFPVFYETAVYIKSKEKFFRPLLSSNGDPGFIFKWKRQIRKDVRQKFEKDEITSYNLDVVTELFAAGIVGLYTYWFFENPSMSCEEISEIGGNLLCGSFYNFKD